MIQRIQSLYLSLTTILSCLFLNGSFLNFTDQSGSLIKVTVTQMIRETSSLEHELIERTFPLSILILLITVLSVLTILLFKKRSLQMWLVKFLIMFVVAFIIVSGVYTYIIMTKYDSHIIPGFKMAIPLLQLIFSVLAYMGIRKDDNLVKSYDRLR
jgi:glucan phosphoethanolaminetransferase (alkaline phosphatase superfamily)